MEELKDAGWVVQMDKSGKKTGFSLLFFQNHFYYFLLSFPQLTPSPPVLNVSKIQAAHKIAKQCLNGVNPEYFFTSEGWGGGGEGLGGGGEEEVDEEALVFWVKALSGVVGLPEKVREGWEGEGWEGGLGSWGRRGGERGRKVLVMSKRRKGGAGEEGGSLVKLEVEKKRVLLFEGREGGEGVEVEEEESEEMDYVSVKRIGGGGGGVKKVGGGVLRIREKEEEK